MNIMFGLYCVHKFMSTYVHCDLDLWPPKSKGFILVKTSQSSLMKMHKMVQFLPRSQSRSVTHTPTDGTTVALLYLLGNALHGDNKGHWIGKLCGMIDQDLVKRTMHSKPAINTSDDMNLTLN